MTARPGWLRRAWCRARLRHLGRIDHDDEGIHWTCTSCGHRLTIRWTEVGDWAL